MKAEVRRQLASLKTELSIATLYKFIFNSPFIASVCPSAVVLDQL